LKPGFGRAFSTEVGAPQSLRESRGGSLCIENEGLKTICIDEINDCIATGTLATDECIALGTETCTI
jgi:hypothetical protein